MMRYVLLMFLTLSLLIITADAGHCKIRLKVKLPVDVKLQHLPQPGSQESIVGTSTGESRGMLLHRGSVVEPVQWRGNEQLPECVRTLKKSKHPDSSCSEVSEQQPESDEQSGSPAGTEEPAYDPLKIVQSGKQAAPIPVKSREGHAMVSRLNSEFFECYRKGIKNIIHDTAFPESDGSDGDMMVTYKGFRMTKSAALRFRRLEELVASSFPGRQIIITSTTEGRHMDPLHAEGKAIDFVVTDLTGKESLEVESLARQSGFTPYNEYIYSSPFKTGDHMHIDLRN